MIKRIRYLVLALGLLVNVATHAVTADVTAYPPATGFPSSATPYDFNGIILGLGESGSGSVPIGSGITVGPIKFTAADGFLVEAAVAPSYGLDILRVQGDGAGDNLLIAEIAGNYRAVGFTYGTSNPLNNIDPFPLSLTVFTGPSASKTFEGIMLPITATGTKFIGFTSPDAITKVVFTQPPSSGTMFNIISFQVAAVPEPSVYAMFVAGLALFGMIGRRRSRK